jgi:hypothetical protein
VLEKAFQKLILQRPKGSLVALVQKSNDYLIAFDEAISFISAGAELRFSTLVLGKAFQS